MDSSIFSALLEWYGISAASGLVGGVTYETLKNASFMGSLKTKLAKFFPSTSKVDTFLENISTKAAVNINKPLRDVEDVYEEVVEDKEYDESINETLKEWVEESKDEIEQFINIYAEGSSGFNIGEQKAGRDIVNVKDIKGDINITNK